LLSFQLISELTEHRMEFKIAQIANAAPFAISAQLISL